MLLSQKRVAASALAALLALSTVAHARGDSLFGSPGLTGTDGKPAQLHRYAGRPAVVFYEDRGSLDANQAVKDALIERGRQEGLLKAVSVIAVANIAAYDFSPAREIATAFIRRAERKAGIPILLDTSGVLQSPPWNLPDDASTVLVLDRDGLVVWRHSGPVPADSREQLFSQLSRLVAAAS